MHQNKCTKILQSVKLVITFNCQVNDSTKIIFAKYFEHAKMIYLTYRITSIKCKIIIKVSYCKQKIALKVVSTEKLHKS